MVQKGLKKQEWTDTDVKVLRDFAGQRTGAAEIARTLGRTEGAVRQKALTIGLSLNARGPARPKRKPPTRRSGAASRPSKKLSKLHDEARLLDVKFNVQDALRMATRRAGAPCHMPRQRMQVRIDGSRVYEPEALVYRGPKLPPDASEVSDPVIVVDILPPPPRRIDSSLKLAGYFSVPSVMHYLIVYPDQPLIIHHARGQGDTILTRIMREGVITLEFGLDLRVGEIYEES